MKMNFKSGSAKSSEELVGKTLPSTSVNTCYNCGVTVVSDEGDWCWECVMAMHDN
jgi:hypothetical protein